VGRLSAFEFQDHSGEAGDHPEEPDCALVDLGADDDLWHVGAGHCRYEVAHQINKLNRDEFPFFVYLVKPFQELHGRHVLESFLEFGLHSETFAQLDTYGDDLPDDAKEEYRV
jgi:hypothetical protein